MNKIHLLKMATNKYVYLELNVSHNCAMILNIKPLIL